MTIRTARLTLVPLTLERLHLALGDREALARSLGARVPESWPSPDMVHLLTFLRPLWTKTGGDGGWTWVIVEDGVVVGEIGAKGGPDVGEDVEIGYGLVPEARGRGVMTEAVEAVVQEAARRGARRVIAHTAPDNGPSHRVLERAGFTRCGETDGEWAWERQV